MLIFTKLVSGEVLIGDLIGKEIRKTVKLSLLPDGNTQVLPVIPFEPTDLPNIKISKTICYTPIDETKHQALISVYHKLVEEYSFQRSKSLH
jgi:hypothetical protein